MLNAAIEEGLSTILDPRLSLQSYAARPLRQLAALRVHDAHREKAGALAREYVVAVAPELSEQNIAGVKRLRNEYLTKIIYGGFTQAPVEKSQREIWAYHAQTRGWHVREFNLLIEHLKDGEKIVEMDGHDATTSLGRTLTRRALLLSLKPAAAHESDFHWLLDHGFRDDQVSA